MKRPWDWRDTLYVILVIGVSGYTIWTLSPLGMSPELRWYRMVAATCRAIAGQVGEWGVRAELHYKTLLERERMI